MRTGLRCWRRSAAKGKNRAAGSFRKPCGCGREGNSKRSWRRDIEQWWKRTGRPPNDACPHLESFSNEGTDSAKGRGAAGELQPWPRERAEGDSTCVGDPERYWKRLCCHDHCRCDHHDDKGISCYRRVACRGGRIEAEFYG